MNMTIQGHNLTNHIKLQKAISIWSTIAGSGFCIGPFLGGYFTSHFSWTYIFWAAIFLVIISIILVFIFIPKDKKILEKVKTLNITQKQESLDIAGIIFIIVGLICVVYSFVKVNDLGWSNPVILILFVIGIVMLIIFYFVEKHAINPILDFTTFKNKEFSLSLIGTLSLFSIILMEIPYLFNIFAQNKTLLNYSAYYAGCALLPLNICYILGSFLSAKITKQLGHYYTLIISLSLQVIGIFMISYFVYYISYVYFVIPFIIIGLGGGITFPCYSFTAISNISKDKIGQASGIFNLTTYFGDLSGTVIWSIIFFYSGSHSLINSISNSTFLQSIDKSTINNLVMGSKASIEKLLNSDIPNKKIIIDQIEKSGIVAFSNAMFYSGVILLIITLLFVLYLKKNKEKGR